MVLADSACNATFMGLVPCKVKVKKINVNLTLLIKNNPDKLNLLFLS